MKEIGCVIFELYLKLRKVSTDTRNIEQGSIFFALKGTNFNGNIYAKEAISLGAIASVVDEIEFEDIKNNIFYVPDVLQALQKLAKDYRNYLKIPFIALTGSNGKTTTKELIASVLKEKYKVHYTFGNLNNHIGVPLTILSIKEDDEIAIIEMGANHQKEIELLSSIAQPDYGYITNFGKAHLEGFGGIEGVIKGKSELYDYLRKNQKTVVVNLEDPIQVAKSDQIKSITFGIEQGDYLIKPSYNNQNFISVIYDNQSINTNLTGNYNFSNISCSIAIGKYFGLTTEQIKNGLENYQPTNSRSQIIIRDNYKIILDAYNANPSSMEVALRNLNTFSGDKIVILGDMFELGENSKKEHEEILRLALDLNLNKIITIGENFYKTESVSVNLIKFLKLEEFQEEINSLLNLSNKTILIKGSNGMKLNVLINKI